MLIISKRRVDLVHLSYMRWGQLKRSLRHDCMVYSSKCQGNDVLVAMDFLNAIESQKVIVLTLEPCRGI